MYVQKKAEAVLKAWWSMLYGGHRSPARKSRENKVEYSATSPRGREIKVTVQKMTEEERKSASKVKEVIALQDGMNTLNSNHGADPLAESLAMAQQAAGVPRETRSAVSTPMAAVVTQKRRVAETFSDSETEDDEEFRGDIRLKTVKRRRKSSVAEAVPQPDEGLFNEYGKVNYRKAWTAEEKAAVYQGVQEYDLGQWAAIKRDRRFAYILRNRTSMQIKDCWRTMHKKNEVPATFDA